MPREIYPHTNILLKLYKQDETIISIAGLRAKTIRFNTESSDLTKPLGEDNWRKVISDYSYQSAYIEGEGMFVNSSAASEMQQSFFDQVLRKWEFIIPNFMRFSGDFHIGELVFSAQIEEMLSFSIAMQSSGMITREAL